MERTQTAFRSPGRAAALRVAAAAALGDEECARRRLQDAAGRARHSRQVMAGCCRA